MLRTGNWLQTSEARAEVVTECTGLTAMVLLGAFILAYTASWRARGIGAVVMVLAILATNQLRVVALVMLMGQERWYTILHEIGWPAYVVIVSSLGFFLWTRYVERNR